MIHELKIWPRFFGEVLAGVKKYEIRKNDRDYKAGDLLLFHEWNPETKEYTGRSCEATIVHITYGHDLVPSALSGAPLYSWFPSEICVFGIEVLA
jgi:hypothetical protein